jgi:group I intron endonuclease
MHVYMIKCEQNGKKYVGSSISDDLDTRIRRHRHDLAAGSHGNSYMQYAWNRHGADSFSFEVVEIVDYDETKTRKENEIMIRRLEDEWIIKENCLTPNGFNCVTAELCVPTQETREKMSEAQRKRPPQKLERKLVKFTKVVSSQKRLREESVRRTRVRKVIGTERSRPMKPEISEALL